MSHKGRYVNLFVLAKSALNFLSSNKDGDDAYCYGLLVLTKKAKEVKEDTPPPSSPPQPAE